MHPDRERALFLRLTRGDTHQVSISRATEWLSLFKTIDPTPNGKYVSWLINLFLAENFLEEDADLYTELLEKFHRFKNQLPKEERDINRHTKGSLATALRRLEIKLGRELPSSLQTQLKQEKIASGMLLINRVDAFEIIRLTTPEAAKYAAKGTAWCVSSLKVGADYIASGPLVFIREVLDTGDYQPILLAHHGYTTFRSHEESESVFAPTTQVKDINDEDIFQSGSSFDPIQIADLLQIGFEDARLHRMRKFSDATDLKMYQEALLDGVVKAPQKVAFDWATGYGQIELDEEYLTRLINMAVHLFGGRDPWIEARILESGNESIILQYIFDTGTISEDLEKYLISDRAKERYIDWVFMELHDQKARQRKPLDHDYLQEFFGIAKRVRDSGHTSP